MAHCDIPYDFFKKIDWHYLFTFQEYIEFVNSSLGQRKRKMK
jgi:hypothetical protein